MYRNRRHPMHEEPMSSNHGEGGPRSCGMAFWHPQSFMVTTVFLLWQKTLSTLANIRNHEHMSPRWWFFTHVSLGRRRAIIQGPRECFWYTSTPVKSWYRAHGIRNSSSGLRPIFKTVLWYQGEFMTSLHFSSAESQVFGWNQNFLSELTLRSFSSP